MCIGSAGRALNLQKVWAKEVPQNAPSVAAASGVKDGDATRFLLTSELTRLVRWLRAVGVDAKMTAGSSTDFDDILEQAEQEGVSCLEWWTFVLQRLLVAKLLCFPSFTLLSSRLFGLHALGGHNLQ